MRYQTQTVGKESVEFGAIGRVRAACVERINGCQRRGRVVGVWACPVHLHGMHTICNQRCLHQTRALHVPHQLNVSTRPTCVAHRRSARPRIAAHAPAYANVRAKVTQSVLTCFAGVKILSRDSFSSSIVPQQFVRRLNFVFRTCEQLIVGHANTITTRQTILSMHQ